MTTNHITLRPRTLIRWSWAGQWHLPDSQGRPVCGRVFPFHYDIESNRDPLETDSGQMCADCYLMARPRYLIVRAAA